MHHCGRALVLCDVFQFIKKVISRVQVWACVCRTKFVRVVFSYGPHFVHLGILIHEQNQAPFYCKCLSNEKLLALLEVCVHIRTFMLCLFTQVELWHIFCVLVCGEVGSGGDGFHMENRDGVSG